MSNDLSIFQFLGQNLFLQNAQDTPISYQHPIIMIQKLSHIFPDALKFIYLPFIHQRCSQLLSFLQSQFLYRMTTSLTSTYIDESELIKSYYQSLKFPSNIHHKQLEQWITDTQKQNRLLLIQSPHGEGKKTFLVNWLNTYLPERKDIKAAFIHFGSFSNNFSEIIYKTLIKLRELLDIGQKVELVQQTLRKYFPYWLQVCSRTLEQNSISEGVDPNQKIILIFQGLDHLVDLKGDHIMPSFWLPSIFPKNIKVIITATTGSKAAKQLMKKAGDVIDYKCPVDVKQHVFSLLPTRVVSHIKALNPSLQYLNLLRCFLNNDKFVKHFQTNLSNLNNFQLKPFLQGVINFWAKQISSSPVKLFISLISFSKKGLTKEQICQAANIKGSIFDQIYSIFSGVICNYKDVYIICDNSIRQNIRNLLKVEEPIKREIHRALADSISTTANCIRKLQEQIYHLQESHNFLQLKQTLSQVENFLFLFNPNTKYILSNCWHRLETRHMFDPTFEYNKSIENYETHYYPSQKDIFRIILQLSRFFMEYAGFETFDTPIFRHPSIDGDEAQLIETSMFQEFKAMSMLMDLNKNRSKLEKLQKFERPEKQREVRGKNKSIGETKTLLDLTQGTDDQISIIQMLQNLNIQIPSNKDRFKQHYLKQLGSFFAQNRLEGQCQISDQQDGEEEQKRKIQIKKQETLKLTKTLKEFQQENFQMNRSQPRYYYYKQWIWVQFPWISLSLDFNYSETIRKCINPPTQYMSIKDEHALTNQALKIAIEAKKTKQSVLEKKPKKIMTVTKKDSSNIKTTQVKKIVHPSVLSKTTSGIETNSILSKSQSQNKIFITQNQKQNSIVLPQINLFSTIRKNVKNKQASHKMPLIQLKKLLDERIYQNKQLNKKLKELQFKMQEQQSNFTEKQIKKTKTKISSNEDKLQSVQAQYAKSLKLLQKISIILNICSINKVHNLQCVSPLNTFTQKLKYMIQDEQKDSAKNKQQFYKAEKEYKREIQKLTAIYVQNQKLLHKQQKLFTHQSDQNEREVPQAPPSKKTTKKTTTINTKTDQIQNPYQYQQAMVSRFKLLIGELDDNITNSRIQQFQQKVETRRVLSERHCSLEFQYENLIKELQEKRKISNTENHQHKQPIKTTFTIKSSLNSLEQEYEKLLKKRVVFQQMIQKIDRLQVVKVVS